MVDEEKREPDGTGESDNWEDPARWDVEYTVLPNATLDRISLNVYGDDYPQEVQPYSFVTTTDLFRFVDALALRAGETLVDLGCGQGGVGLWIARRTRADLIGVDLSPSAIARARQRIAAFGLAGHARFEAGDLRRTGLADQSCHGAVSVDVLWTLPEKGAAIAETARILRPGAAFVFTTWEAQADPESYRAPLEQHGFQVQSYEEKPDWRRRQLAFYQGVVANEPTLMREMGAAAAAPLLDEATECLAGGLAEARHLFVVARKA